MQTISCLSPKFTGDSEIQAVSGATVTSDAVTNGVNLASQYYSEVLQSGGGENEAVKDN